MQVMTDYRSRNIPLAHLEKVHEERTDCLLGRLLVMSLCLDTSGSLFGIARTNQHLS